MAAFQRPREDLEECLQRQIRHLRRSLAAYEDGVWEEAERLSTAVYTLVVDGTHNTKSLLGQLGLQEDLEFQSARTAAVVYSGCPLCGVRQSGEEPRYFPLYLMPETLHRTTTYLPFSDWWNEQVYIFKPGLALDRKMVVKSLRDQDGGTHVDGGLSKEAYHLIVSMGFNRIRWEDGKARIVMRLNGPNTDPERATEFDRPPYRNPPIAGAHWATMAQIAWELDNSLVRAGIVGPR